MRCALFVPVISCTIQNPVNIFKDILTEFSLYISPGGKRYLTHKMINYGEYKTKWLQQFSGALLVPFNLYRLFCCCGGDFFHSESFPFSCSLLTLITVIVHGLLSLKIICCLVYLPCSWFIHSCSSVPCYSDWRVKLLIFTEQGKHFHLLKVYKGRIIKWLQW